VYEFQVASKWAFEGKLEDISDVINPIKARFAPNTVETTFLYNDKDKKKAYYAYPLKQQTMHIQYWIDMLQQAGFKEGDIPKGWKDYWSFWCDKVQPAWQGCGLARLRHRPAARRRFERQLLFLPHLHGRL
jgi:multiple sugar transport system substrate-binding protein